MRIGLLQSPHTHPALLRPKRRFTPLPPSRRPRRRTVYRIRDSRHAAISNFGAAGILDSTGQKAQRPQDLRAVRQVLPPADETKRAALKAAEDLVLKQAGDAASVTRLRPASN
jgi:alkylhydroperoxidase family enzyme